MTNKASERQNVVHSTVLESTNPWPFRIKLTTDNLRWDSLKISALEEFEEHIIANLDEESRKAFESWNPVEMFIYDVDTCDTYRVCLAKKESFWFKPLPDVGQKTTKLSCCNGAVNKEHVTCDLNKGFAYCIQPFRQIVKKRNLGYDQEIGFCWSGSKSVNKFDFSVLYTPRLSLQSLRT